MTAFRVHGRRWSSDDLGFDDALAAAHADRHRPLCLCLLEGLEMYVAKLGSGYIVKRMPNTGSRHAPDCPSYEPPPGLSGLGELMGSAITEDTMSGVTSLKLGFPMSKTGARTIDPGSGGGSDSVASDGSKLTLRALLHYLWEQAELTRWQPGFVGKRSWATVRKHLLLAAEGKIARGRALQDRLYVPEVFAVEHRDAINSRRIAQWMHATTCSKGTRPLMLLIGEVKEIVPARFGFRAVIKHVPDQAFALDEQLYRRMGKRFERELSLWGASDHLRMLAIATFGVGSAGVPTVEELSLMPTNGQWIPVEDSFDLQLVDRLVREGRRFTKGMRYNVGADRPIATAVLLDTPSPCALGIVRPNEDAEAPSRSNGPGIDGQIAAWSWDISRSHIPPLPAAVGRPSQEPMRPKPAPLPA